MKLLVTPTDFLPSHKPIHFSLTHARSQNKKSQSSNQNKWNQYAWLVIPKVKHWQKVEMMEVFELVQLMKYGHSNPLPCPVSDTRSCQCSTPTRHPYYVLYFGHYRCSRVCVRCRCFIGATPWDSFLSLESHCWCPEFYPCLALEWLSEGRSHSHLQ